MRTMLLSLATAFALSGCLMVRTGPGRPPVYSGSRSPMYGSPGGQPQCHPSQYWDGEMCRHKGEGHGARKHDG